jgi:predicted Zn-dependent protease with MMP-like domain
MAHRKPKRPAASTEERLDRGWDAFDRGDLEAALHAVRGVDPDDPERCVLEANVLLESDDLHGARAALERSGESEGDDAEPQVLWTSAEIELRCWNIERARELFERTAQAGRVAPLLARLALCAELLGDLARADALLAEAAELDPDVWPAPPRLSESEFEGVLDEAVGQLPPEFRSVLSDTPILVEAVPDKSLIRLADTASTPPDMLGLFVGPSQLDRSVQDALELPASIHLFQRNLERAALDRDELIEETRITLFHEIGHMLGFDEKGVEEMGLE